MPGIRLVCDGVQGVDVIVTKSTNILTDVVCYQQQNSVTNMRNIQLN